LKSVQTLFENNLKAFKKLARLFENWQEETRTETLETDWVWAAWVS
jgi:hypothetical protein